MRFPPYWQCSAGCVRWLPLLVIPASPCWPCEPPASAAGRLDLPLGEPNSQKSHFRPNILLIIVNMSNGGGTPLLTPRAAKSVGAGVSVQRVKNATWAFSHLPRGDSEQQAAHRSSVRTSLSVWDLIPLPLTCRQRGGGRIDFTRIRGVFRPSGILELTSTTTTSTSTFGGKSSSGWNRFAMATSRWMVARRSLLWMTDRRAADNNRKSGKTAHAGIMGELSTSF